VGNCPNGREVEFQCGFGSKTITADKYKVGYSIAGTLLWIWSVIDATIVGNKQSAQRNSFSPKEKRLSLQIEVVRNTPQVGLACRF